MGGGSATRVTVAPVSGLINLGAGDPDFNQPKFVADAVYKAMQEGYTHYEFGGTPISRRQSPTTTRSTEPPWTLRRRSP